MYKIAQLSDGDGGGDKYTPLLKRSKRIVGAKIKV